MYDGKIERYPCMHIPPSSLSCLLPFEVKVPPSSPGWRVLPSEITHIPRLIVNQYSKSNQPNRTRTQNPTQIRSDPTSPTTHRFSILQPS